MLTRKMLAAMEIDAEKISQIIEAHAETVAGLKDEIEKKNSEIEKYKAEVETLSSTQKELTDLKEKVAAEAKEREGKDYDKLQKEFEDYKADIQRKAVHASKEEAYKAILKDAGIPEKHFAKILKYSDVDGVELDDKGKITTAKDIMKSIKDEWSDHIEQTQTHGANTPTPPASNGGAKPTKEDIMKIKDPEERQRAIAENMDVFGY